MNNFGCLWAKLRCAALFIESGGPSWVSMSQASIWDGVPVLYFCFKCTICTLQGGLGEEFMAHFVPNFLDHSRWRRESLRWCHCVYGWSAFSVVKRYPSQLFPLAFVCWARQPRFIQVFKAECQFIRASRSQVLKGPSLGPGAISKGFKTCL